MENLKTIFIAAVILSTFASFIFQFNNAIAQLPTLTQGDYIYGPIIGVTNTEGSEWIMFGNWKTNLSNMTGNQNNTSGVFDAAIEMIRPDGTARHTHALANFVVSNSSSPDGNSTVFNGTSTINMEHGPITNVPTSIKLSNGNVMSIWLDPETVDHHFGDVLIYGVTNTQGGPQGLQQGGPQGLQQGGPTT